MVISAAIENQHFRPFLTALRIGTLGGVFGKVPASWPETEKTVIICHFGVIPGVPTSFFWGFLGIMLIIPEFPGIPCAQNVHTRKSECANSRFRIPRRRKSAPIPTPRHPRHPPRHPPHPHPPTPPQPSELIRPGTYRVGTLKPEQTLSNLAKNSISG